MTEDHPPPPPPPSAPPPGPPRSAPPPPVGQDGQADSGADNGIAIAGLVVALLGLVLSVIVVGGVVGIIGIVLSAVGYRRSKNLGGRGRTAAVTGIGLGLLSIVASVAFVGVLLDTLNGGEEITVDGVTTSSTNTEFPPQDDLLDVTCESSDTCLLYTSPSPRDRG